MSLKTWKEEFYPEEDLSKVKKEDAVAHSLLKWKGLPREMLKKHLLYKKNEEATLHDTNILGQKGDSIEINSNTCALCYHYLEDKEDDGEDGGGTSTCTGCPLYAVRGGVRCDEEMEGENISPYHDFISTSYSRPMRIWLERAGEFENMRKGWTDVS